ncbi:MAG: DNA-directed RNA polymerase subunit alpha, partial [Microgenomates group bacterium Gr01-1014_93]
IEILLNLKKVNIAIHQDKPLHIKLSASGKREVKASDLEILGDGEIANGQAHIATLTSPKAKLNMELIVETGKGFSSADERKTNEIGSITVDAVFSPVISVNYDVEPTRVGRKTDFDKLNLEIQTNGTITPKEALEEAAKILSSNFKQIYEPIPEDEQEVVSSLISDEVLNLTVEELDLPVRITNALKAIDINIIPDLISVQRGTLLKAKNLGTKSISLISEKLSERGLTLSEA